MKRKGLTFRVMLALVLVLLLALPVTVGAQERTGDPKGEGATAALQSVSVTSPRSANDLASLLVGTEVTLSNITYTGDARGSGSFSGGTGTVGFASGVVLGSGRVIDVVGPNTSDATTMNFGKPGDSDLDTLIPGDISYDATLLEFDFTCPSGSAVLPTISFNYVFTSEEYNEYVNSQFNDVFGWFLNGTNIALLPDGVTPVAINNVNNGYSGGGGLPGTPPISNPAYYINNDLNDGGGSIDIEADGLTVVFVATATVNPGLNHMKLAIADAGDRILDSWVFLEENSFHCNSPPVADAGGPYSGDEGSPIGLDGSGSSDPDGDTLTYSWSVNDPAPCSFNNAASATPNLTCTDNGVFTVTLEVDDGQVKDSDTEPVTVSNVAPTASFSNSGSVDEGTSFSLFLTNPDDPSSDDTAAGFTYAFDCGGGFGAFSDSSSAVCSTDDNGTRSVKGEIRDKDLGVTQYTDSVEVANVAPTVSIDSVAPTLVAVGEDVTATGSFTDPGTADTHTAEWDWGDTTTSAGSVTGLNVGPDMYAYSAAGIYTIELTVTDDDGGVGTAVYQYVVVYDPDAGFVTGGGWIDSPAGAYVPDDTLAGKANFGFVSKYKKGKTTPDGQTEFQFHAGDLNFHSDSYAWLVVTGSDYAMFKGVGTINGEGVYKFRIWAGDDAPDTFRIKIWVEDEGGETVIYDNGSDQAIGGGSIVIHTKK